MSAVQSRSAAHRCKLGEQVSLARGFGHARQTGAVYVITALLPSGQTHFQYRIRSKAEIYERVAAENELKPTRPLETE